MVEKSQTKNENIIMAISFADLQFHLTFENKLFTDESLFAINNKVITIETDSVFAMMSSTKPYQ